MTMAPSTRLQGPSPPPLGFAVGAIRWLGARWSLEWALAIISLGALTLLWEFARPLGLAGIDGVPPPSEVLRASAKLINSSTYWQAWGLSLTRVAFGFLAAQIEASRSVSASP